MSQNGESERAEAEVELAEALADDNERLIGENQKLKAEIKRLEGIIGRITHQGLADMATVKAAMLDIVSEAPSTIRQYLRRWTPFGG